MKIPFLFENGLIKALFVKAKSFLGKISIFPLVFFLAFLPYRVLKIVIRVFMILKTFK